MTVAQLITHLRTLPQDLKFVSQDDSCITQPMNGLPYVYTITDDDGANHGDLEDRVGECVVMFSVGD